MQAAGTFRVLDVHHAPHGGLILRLRLQGGEAPSIRSLRSARLVAEGPAGESSTWDVGGFAMFGGKTSDARLSRTGRVDVHVSPFGEEQPEPGIRWTVRLA